MLVSCPNMLLVATGTIEKIRPRATFSGVIQGPSGHSANAINAASGSSSPYMRLA